MLNYHQESHVFRQGRLDCKIVLFGFRVDKGAAASHADGQLGDVTVYLSECEMEGKLL